jgi:excisionase family DNA binding protein
MLTVNEAAEALGVSTQRVYRLLHTRVLTGVKTPEGWRVDDGSVSRYKPRPGGRPLHGVEYPVLGGDGHALGYVRKDECGWHARVIGSDVWSGPHASKAAAEAAVWTETRWGPMVAKADAGGGAGL